MGAGNGAEGAVPFESPAFQKKDDAGGQGQGQPDAAIGLVHQTLLHVAAQVAQQGERLAGMEGKMSPAAPPSSGDPTMHPTADHMNAAIAGAEARMQALVSEIRGDIKTMGAQLQSTSQSVDRMRTTIYGVLLPAVLSILVALVGVYFAIKTDNQALIGNMFNAFNTGRETAAAITQATEELKAIRERLDKATPAAPPK